MKIFENEKSHLAAFVRLNQQWIEKYFHLEAVDLELAQNPQSIIEKGGFVFTLAEENPEIVVGACALFKGTHDGEFELARMAVDEKKQGRGYGRILMDCAFTKLSFLKAKKVFLLSNTKLESAIELYKKVGFLVDFNGNHPVYKRANIGMSKTPPF